MCFVGTGDVVEACLGRVNPSIPRCPGVAIFQGNGDMRPGSWVKNSSGITVTSSTYARATVRPREDRLRLRVRCAEHMNGASQDAGDHDDHATVREQYCHEEPQQRDDRLPRADRATKGLARTFDSRNDRICGGPNTPDCSRRSHSSSCKPNSKIRFIRTDSASAHPGHHRHEMIRNRRHQLVDQLDATDLEVILTGNGRRRGLIRTLEREASITSDRRHRRRGNLRLPRDSVSRCAGPDEFNRAHVRRRRPGDLGPLCTSIVRHLDAVTFG